MSAIGLPAHILALFVPRPPLEFVGRPVRARRNDISGIADFIGRLCHTSGPHSNLKSETALSSRLRKKREVQQKTSAVFKEEVEFYMQRSQVYASDHEKTLFVARLSYDTTERDLRREFEIEFGVINSVALVYDNKGRSRGYGFIEFDKERDMREAYKRADGKRIAGRRILVDIERGRSIPGWVPRRLGGGRGPGRALQCKK